MSRVLSWFPGVGFYRVGMTMYSEYILSITLILDYILFNIYIYSMLIE